LCVFFSQFLQQFSLQAYFSGFVFETALLIVHALQGRDKKKKKQYSVFSVLRFHSGKIKSISERDKVIKTKIFKIESNMLTIQIVVLFCSTVYLKKKRKQMKQKSKKKARKKIKMMCQCALSPHFLA
jgi:hypothetical protein